MTQQDWQYNGSWLGLKNTAAQKKGSIHDDEPARKLGFKGAFVPGSVVGACAMPAILDCFSADWFKGGWYDFNFVTPVYTTDRVRCNAVFSDESITCRVETDDDRLCCAGRAGLGYEDPWRSDENVPNGSEQVFPEAQIGTTFDQRTLDISRADVQPTLDATEDDSPCWESLIHPQHLMVVALRTVNWDLVPLVGVKAPGMWAQHAIKVSKPMPYGNYRIVEKLASKGSSGRTHFVDFQFALFNDSGNEMAVGRHKCKFIREDA